MEMGVERELDNTIELSLVSQLQYKDNGALESGIGTVLTRIVMSWLHTFMEYITTTIFCGNMSCRISFHFRWITHITCYKLSKVKQNSGERESQQILLRIKFREISQTSNLISMFTYNLQATSSICPSPTASFTRSPRPR